MKIGITETVLRDGHQSLIATRMSTADMLPILEKLDQIGYFSLEMWGGATFDVCMRYLNEDPWERLRQMRSVVKNTKLQMLLRGQNLVGYRHYPDDIVIKFVEKAKENGIAIFRIFDAVNDIRNMTTAIKTAKKVGAIVEGAISYTVSPVHTIEKYIKFALELKELGSDIICIKDMAGLISPAMAYDLVNHLKKEVKLPVHLHSHCTSGMAPIAYLTACEAGVDILDTAISPFAWGSSQPPTETIVGSLKGTPFDTGLDLEKLTEIAEYFQKIRTRYQNILDPLAERVDPKIMVHQIPGGMISNLISQLKQQNALDKYEEVLKETARVRKDLGYPPLVTPTSQIVGTQAVLNVMTGERYKVIPKEVKDYIRGLYGQPPGPIDEEVKKKAIGGEEQIKGRPADGLSPEFETARAAIKDFSDKDEDILSYAIFPQVAREFFEKRRQGITQGTPTETAPDRAEDTVKQIIPLQMNLGKAPAEYSLLLNKKKFYVTVSRNSKGDRLYVDFGSKRHEVNLENSLAVLSQQKTPSPAAEQPSKITVEKTLPKPLPAKPAPDQDKQVEEKHTKPAATPSNVSPANSTNLKDVIVPMPGKVVSIKVKVGDRVKEGEMLFILEAMKMQNEIDSPAEGVIAEINTSVGATVDNATPVIRINPA